jgi:anaerobic ribonucleoside-triphosphate reductase activating protein
MDNSTINLHALIPASRVNGPGLRMVVFFQGCARRCQGCFNPETHPFDVGRRVGVEALFANDLRDTVEGITVSGGEPFSQPAPLYALLKAAKARGLSTVVYSGFTYVDMASNGERCKSLPLIDVLIDGAYDESCADSTLLARGSTNQTIHLLTPRYTMDDLYLPGKAEVIISADGTILSTGFSRTLFTSGQL